MKYKRSLRLQAPPSIMKTSHLSVLTQPPRLTAISTLYLLGTASITSKKNRHCRDSLCIIAIQINDVKKLISSMLCNHVYLRCLCTQMSKQMSLGSRGCPRQGVQESIG